MSGTWSEDLREADWEQEFQESLVGSLQDSDEDRDQYLGGLHQQGLAQRVLTSLGLSLRELIHEFKHQTLVLFKCCLLQPKVCDLGTPAIATAVE